VGLELKRRKMRRASGISFALAETSVKRSKRRCFQAHRSAKARAPGNCGDSRTFSMRRLLQGDVGSGKTIVALQPRLSPWKRLPGRIHGAYGILAIQHYLSARGTLEDAGYRVVAAHRLLG